MTGDEMHALMAELFPICRSITGNGLRETLRHVAARIPLDLTEVPSGTRVLDWTVPNEWNVRDAWIEGPGGERIVDFHACNLHLMSYSTPVRRRMTLAELRPHLHTLPDQPDWIPYRTSYYEENWGFCLRHRVFETLLDGEYEVRIDTTLEPGSLTYGECIVPGDGTDEVLISTHCCHPSLANDNLSGIAVAVGLARHVLALPRRRYTYRFLFIPGTIGAIAWLARNDGAATTRIRHGLVLTGLGDRGPLTYKRSRQGNAVIDHAAAHVVGQADRAGTVRDFSPYGYDERQYCSPGFDLPVGRLSRTPHGEYPEYHTSADDLAFVRPERLADSLSTLAEIVEILEHDARYVNTHPKGEPQLGRRGLYGGVGGARLPGYEMALLWVLNGSDGRLSLLDIAERAGLPFQVIQQAAAHLLEHGLLREPPPS